MALLIPYNTETLHYTGSETPCDYVRIARDLLTPQYLLWDIPWQRIARKTDVVADATDSVTVGDKDGGGGSMLLGTDWDFELSWGGGGRLVEYEVDVLSWLIPFYYFLPELLAYGSVAIFFFLMFSKSAYWLSMNSL